MTVHASFDDPTGTRCVDVIAQDGGFSWAEFRRDPEDGHGWRPTGLGQSGFATSKEAQVASRTDCPWVPV